MFTSKLTLIVIGAPVHDCFIVDTQMRIRDFRCFVVFDPSSQPVGYVTRRTYRNGKWHCQSGQIVAIISQNG